MFTQSVPCFPLCLSHVCFGAFSALDAIDNVTAAASNISTCSIGAIGVFDIAITVDFGAVITSNTMAFVVHHRVGVVFGKVIWR